jgi:hypothetical protein
MTTDDYYLPTPGPVRLDPVAAASLYGGGVPPDDPLTVGGTQIGEIPVSELLP